MRALVSPALISGIDPMRAMEVDTFCARPTHPKTTQKAGSRPSRGFHLLAIGGEKRTFPYAAIDKLNIQHCVA